MGNILHGGAKTTPKIRKEIQEPVKSIAALARQYDLNQKNSSLLEICRNDRR